MPAPSWFQRSPRPDQNQEQAAQPDGSPASQSSSRFGALHHNVRSMINGSSVYSQDTPPTSNQNTPKIPFLGFLRRPPPDPITVPGSDAPRDSSDSRNPLRAPPHTAGSYMRTIAPLQDTAGPETVVTYGDRHPADVPLEYGQSVDPETRQLQAEVHGHRRRRKHRNKRKTQHRYTHWVRRRSRGSICVPMVKTQAARGKLFASLISGLFLTTVLAIYLALALSRTDLGQEIHVLFIMIILATTIFFCHSLIRLFMLALHPPDETPSIPSMTGPEGFNPVRPIRVHLARDEELGNVDAENVEEDDIESPEEKKIAPPPPAYGLWRSSVRVDPNLLHWQRVENNSSSMPPAHPGSRNGSVSSTTSVPVVRNGSPTPQQGNEAPRPPSYVSDDGVSYIMEAAPRSTVAASHTGVSDIHPAWRPGYAMSEVTEWPAPRRV